MSAQAADNSTGRTSIRTTFGALMVVALLVGGAALGSDSAASAEPGDDWHADISSCDDAGDVYRLDEPGLYTAFVSTPASSAVVEVRGLHGEVLATSPSSVANAAAVDLATGVRFGVAPPPVFDVKSSVLIHVSHDESPYELVLVRLDRREEWSGLDVHPPVETMVRDSDSCLIGDHPETMRIRTDGVYSDTTARQVFRIAS